MTCGCYSASREAVFPEPEFWDAGFMSVAKDLVCEIYVPGYKYKRCGVVLSSLSDMSRGGPVIKPAALFDPDGVQGKWVPKSEHRRQGAQTSDGSNLPVCGRREPRFQNSAADFIR